jgi:hypothetical protein
MDNIFIAPASESLFYDLGSVWPSELIRNEKLRLLTGQRLRLCENLDYLFNLLARPGFSLSRVVSDPNCDLERIINLYDGLSNFIKESDVNRRLMLYLPFEIIPERGIGGPDLFKKAVLNFQATYFEAWFNLLFKSEFRANFSDGDIWEPELGYGQSEMICKATHLIPVLLQKRLISFEQVIRLLNEASSEKLKSGVSEALMAANELGIITYSPAEFQNNQESDFMVIDDQKNLALLMTEAVQQCADNKENVARRWSSVFPGRIIWEEEASRQQIIKKYATIISNSIISNHLEIDIFAKHIKTSLNPYFILLSIYSLQMMVEKMDSYKQPRAALIANDFKSWLFRTGQIDFVDIKKAIESTVQRWFNADIVGVDYLSSFGFAPLDFNSRFSGEKVCSFLEVKELTRSISLIQESSELSTYFYPVVLIYGSRVKGYGSSYADIDLAVFVRPEVDCDSKRELVTLALKTVFAQEKIEGKVLQFWLASNNKHLSVKEIDGNHRFIAKNFYAHVLFDGAWFGQVEAIKELHAKLLVPYFFDEDVDFIKICLRELERYNLQYRLLHKGYANFFPRRGGLATKFIDGQSTFYDSGYRELATKIFIKKIFLPKLSI